MLRASAVAALLLLSPAGARAQDADDKPRKRDLLVTVGFGPQISPRFPGSDELRLSPLPNFSFRKEGDAISFEAPDEGAGFALIGKKSRFQLGPAVQFQSKRKEKDVGAAVGNVGFTVEAGIFAQAILSPAVRLRAEGRRGIGGHEGWLGDVGLDLISRRGDSTIMSIGPRLRLADGRYQRAYFGVTPAVTAVTGLAPHDPSAGVRAVGIMAGLTHQFSDRWGIYGYAGYDRLVGEAADSPIVRVFGSRDQPSAGLALTYTFKVRRGRKKS